MATAVHSDIWAGECPAQVVAFRSTVRGERVTLYRWQRDDAVSVNCFRPFASVARAVQAAERHADFSRVEG